jgi:hypothetical protein
VGDTAFTGNFVGGAEADRVVFRRGVWYIADGATSATTQVSTGGRIPVTVDWNGDGYQDPGVFNDMTGKWTIGYLGTYAYATFGQFGDLPAGGH